MIVALRAGYLLCLAARDKRVPRLARVVAAACAAYVISPVNLIPDEIPVIGELDDAVVVVFGVVVARRLVPAPLLAELRAKAAERFPERKSVPASHRTRIGGPLSRPGRAFGVDPIARSGKRGTDLVPGAVVETELFGSVSVRRRNCPLCDRNNEGEKPSGYSQRPWTIRQCPDCRFVYIDTAPHYDVQFQTMAWERTTKFEEQRRAEIRPISYPVSKRTRFRLHLLPKRTMLGYIKARIESGNILDLGCGDGQALTSFPPSFRPFGIDVSSAAATIADRAFRARGGYAINAPCVEGLLQFGEGFFVAATLRSYLEHEAEPLAVLENLRRVLVPAGVAVVKVPNYGSLNRKVTGPRWCGFRYPDHLNHFTPETLRAMAGKAGFETRFGLTGRLPTSDNMWAVLTKFSG